MSNEGIDLRNISIRLSSWDLDEQKGETLVFNGKTKKIIQEAYGENNWQVGYRNKMFAGFRRVSIFKNPGIWT